MGCVTRELEAFRIEKGYFPKDQVCNTAQKDSRGIPAATYYLKFLIKGA
ncbi:hypothetical protein [Crocosphaera sp.]|nr:hypothetical protein [Crocosphaera sp.]